MFYSQCPGCETVRTVAAEEIGSGNAVVDCEHCDTAYNLAWHLIDRLEDAALLQLTHDAEHTATDASVTTGLTSTDWPSPRDFPKAPVQVTPTTASPETTKPALSGDLQQQPELYGPADLRPASNPAGTNALPSIVDSNSSAAQTEPAELDGALEAPPSNESAKIETTRIESTEIESTKVESAKVESAKVESTKVESSDAATTDAALGADLEAAPATPEQVDQAAMDSLEEIEPRPASADADDRLEPASSSIDVDSRPTLTGQDDDSLETDELAFQHNVDLPTEERLAARRARRRKRRQRRRQEKRIAQTRARYWALGSIALSLLFVLQLRLFYLNILNASSVTRPIAMALCSVMSCDNAPLPRDLSMFEINSTVVRNHPDVPNALSIVATVTNTAAHDQAYPNVQLTLTDPKGKIISRRRFVPGQYIPNYTEASARLASNSAEELRLDISNPSKRAIGFEFELVQ